MTYFLIKETMGESQTLIGRYPTRKLAEERKAFEELDTICFEKYLVFNEEEYSDYLMLFI